MVVNNPISVVILNDLKKAFMQKAHPTDAFQMRAYMKNRFNFFGIKSQARREIQSAVLATHRPLDINETLNIVPLCWEQEEREFQYAAMDMLEKFKTKLTVEHLMQMERLIVTKSWWDTVDKISSHFVGQIFKNESDVKEKTIQNWMDSGNMWLQRSCLLFQLFYKEETDFDLLSSLILLLEDSNEFFIQKASGWSLRQYSKTNPDAVAIFLKDNSDLPALTRKEAAKYI